MAVLKLTATSEFALPSESGRCPPSAPLRQKSGPPRETSDQVVKSIRRATRKRYSAEEKIRIVLDGLRGEDGIAELCRREGIAQSLYCSWSKEFLEAGKRRLAGDTARQSSSAEVKSITDLAAQEGATLAYVCRLLPLSCLAPDIVAAILDGRQPPALTLARLMKPFPGAGEEQRAWLMSPDAAR